MVFVGLRMNFALAATSSHSSSHGYPADAFAAGTCSGASDDTHLDDTHLDFVCRPQHGAGLVAGQRVAVGAVAAGAHLAAIHAFVVVDGTRAQGELAAWLALAAAARECKLAVVAEQL